MRSECHSKPIKRLDEAKNLLARRSAEHEDLDPRPWRTVPTGWAAGEDLPWSRGERTATGIGALACGVLHEWFALPPDAPRRAAQPTDQPITESKERDERREDQQRSSGERGRRQSGEGSRRGGWYPPLAILLHIVRQALVSRREPGTIVWIGRRCWPCPLALRQLRATEPSFALDTTLPRHGSRITLTPPLSLSLLSSHTETHHAPRPPSRAAVIPLTPPRADFGRSHVTDQPHHEDANTPRENEQISEERLRAMPWIGDGPGTKPRTRRGINTPRDNSTAETSTARQAGRDGRGDGGDESNESRGSSGGDEPSGVGGSESDRARVEESRPAGGESTADRVIGGARGAVGLGPRGTTAKRRAVRDGPDPCNGPDPLASSLFIAPIGHDERVWAADLALRCPFVAAVVMDGSRLTMAESRRLQLAAAIGGGLGLIARPSWEQSELSAAHTRWLVRSLPSDLLEARWTVDLVRCKGVQPTALENSRRVVVRRDHETGVVGVAETVVGGSGAPEGEPLAAGIAAAARSA